MRTFWAWLRRRRTKTVRIRCRCQRGLVVGHLDGDDGDWVFTLCREHIQRVIKRRLRVGERITLDVRLTEVDGSES